MSKRTRTRLIAGLAAGGAVVSSVGVLTLLGCGGNSVAEVAHAVAHWTYRGDTGPDHWGDISPDYAACKTGTHQSPIDFANPVPNAALPLLSFANYQATPLKVKNNGHAIQVDYEAGSKLTYEGKDYDVLQFHFHSPSEHTEGGRPHFGEMHIVHQLHTRASAPTSELLVVGVFMRDGAENAVLKRIWDLMPEHEGESAQSGTINVKDLLPANTGPYYHYTGSLTTPPCTEAVKNWIVLVQPIEFSTAQRNKFLNVIGENARPVQPLNGRTVEVRP